MLICKKAFFLGFVVSHLTENSTLSLTVIGSVIAGAFTGYQWLEPKLNQIGVNRTQIEVQAKNNDKIDRKLDEMTKLLHRIDGQLKEIKRN